MTMTIEELKELVKCREGQEIPPEWAAWFTLAKEAIRAENNRLDNLEIAESRLKDAKNYQDYAHYNTQRRDNILMVMDKLAPGGVPLEDNEAE